MRITIVYDNEANPGLRSGWGFSCLVEAEERILFDTGPTGEELLFNIERLAIEARSIDKVIISHEHWDHIGGLRTLIEINSDIQVFKPDSLLLLPIVIHRLEYIFTVIVLASLYRGTGILKEEFQKYHMMKTQILLTWKQEHMMFN